MVRQQAIEIVRRLQSAGYEAFWVGGCVRDQLLGHLPVDYDIATSALPKEVESVFPHTIAVGRKFGVSVVIEAGNQFQVATFRAEAEYRDGRHPEHVSYANAQADAQRRDFTVNGLFFDPVRRELHDWVGGKADLDHRLIRTIGSPSERFGEDHLRLLRAIRFAAQLGFTVEPETFAAIQAGAAGINRISSERIRDELLKLFRPTHAGRGLQLLSDSGLLGHILPEIAALGTCEQSADFHPEGNVFNHTRLMLEMVPAGADPLLPWAVLLHDVAKPNTASRDDAGGIHFYGHEKVGALMAESLLERLRFPRKQINDIVQSVRFHMQFKDARQMRRSTRMRMLMRSTFALELELHRLDCLGSHGRLDAYNFLKDEVAALAQLPDLKPSLLTGRDLMLLGMRPGPEMGMMLAEVREKQLQDELRTPDEARDWVKRRLSLPPNPGA